MSSCKGFQVFHARANLTGPRSRKINGHRVIKAESGGYRCSCGEPLAERITAARDVQRFHVADVRMQQDPVSLDIDPNTSTP